MKRFLIAIALTFMATTALAAPPPFIFATDPALLLPKACTNGQTATYTSATNRWACAALSGGGDFLADGSVPMTGPLDLSTAGAVATVGEIGYASNVFSWMAGATSEKLQLTAGANLWTFSSDTAATFAFTPSVGFTAGAVLGPAGNAISVSSGGVATFAGTATLTSPPITTAITPISAGGATLGTTDLEWGGLYLGDAKPIYFQADQSVYLTPGAGTLTLTAAGEGLSFTASANLWTISSGTDAVFTTDKQWSFTANPRIYDGSHYLTLDADGLTGDATITFGANTNNLKIDNGTAGLDIAAAAALNIDTSLQITTGAVVIAGQAGGSSVTLPSTGTLLAADGSGASLTGLQFDQFITQTAWRVFYSNGDGDVTELALGASGTYLMSNGASSAPTFETPAGSGDVTGVGDCSGGACLDGSSDGGTYISLYDGDSHKTSLYAGNSIADLAFYLPTTAGATGGMPYYSGANQLANLAAGTEGYILKMGATVPEWSNSLSVSSISSGGIVLGDTTPDADGEIGYASNAFLWFANSEDLLVTASANLWTWSSATGATIAFTPAVNIVGSLTVGPATPDDVQPSLIIKGDADSDAGGDTTDSFTVTLTANADPTLAKWGITSTQSAGYTFDRPVQAPAKFVQFTDAATLTAAGHNGALVMMTTANEVTMWDCTATTIGHWVTLWARDAEKIEVVPASGDQFYLFDGTGIGADDELDMAATAGTKVTLMCTAENEWRVVYETAACADGGAAD